MCLFDKFLTQNYQIMSLTTPLQIRILCLGASITAGFHRFGLAHHPYSRQLKKDLEKSFPNAEFDVRLDAASGDVVLGGSYLGRLDRQAMSHMPKYDWIIVQGGGNDLGQGSEPQAVFEGLKIIWRKALSLGAKVMALTVTETSNESPVMRSRYRALNQMILNHQEEGFSPFDLCAAIPYHDMAPDKRKIIWDDGLHLKKAGYDLMGSTIAQHLEKTMSEGLTSKL